MSDLVRGLIDRLASIPSPDTTEALEALLNDAALRSWRPALLDAADRQKAVRRIETCGARSGNQLIAKYTPDPGAAGYGIYLVFWLGNEPEPCQMPESGPRPKSAAALEERLRDTLSPEEARLISVRVIDIARPGTRLAEGAARRP